MKALIQVLGVACADTILVPLDRKVKLVDGVVQVVQNPKPDAVAVVNLAANPPAVTSVIENVPVSVVGPPSSVALTPDGKRALVSRDGDHKITVLNVDGTNVTLANRDINAGLHSYGIDIARDGRTAVVANIGVGMGDSDTISVIDLATSPPRVRDTLSVGQTPEGMAFSPDG